MQMENGRIVSVTARNKDGEEEQLKEIKEKLYIKFDVTNIPLYNSIIKIMNTYPGNTEVIVKCTATEKAFKLNKTIAISQHLLGELLGILSENDIIIK